jgi:hypothetical protein
MVSPSWLSVPADQLEAPLPPAGRQLRMHAPLTWQVELTTLIPIMVRVSVSLTTAPSLPELSRQTGL